MPQSLWGTEFVAPEFVDRPGMYFLVRIQARDDGTTLTFDPPSIHAPTTLGAGGHLDVVTTADVAVSVTGRGTWRLWKVAVPASPSCSWRRARYVRTA